MVPPRKNNPPEPERTAGPGASANWNPAMPSLTTGVTVQSTVAPWPLIFLYETPPLALPAAVPERASASSAQPVPLVEKPPSSPPSKHQAASTRQSFTVVVTCVIAIGGTPSMTSPPVTFTGLVRATRLISTATAHVSSFSTELTLKLEPSVP